ncbi:MAG: YagU family protein [Cellulomonadaceae bacterium]
MSRFTVTTEPHRRRIGVAVLVGLIAGVVSGFIKFGWEVPFPPRTADRLTPPAILLDKLGIDVDSMTYTFSGHELNYGNFIIHFAFAIFFAVLYVVVAEYWPAIKLWQGVAFGLIIWVVFHLLLMPPLGLTPPTLDLPFDEQVSELFGHAFWMWSIEIVRRDLRSRITREPDAEAALHAA